MVRDINEELHRVDARLHVCEIWLTTLLKLSKGTSVQTAGALQHDG